MRDEGHLHLRCRLLQVQVFEIDPFGQQRRLAKTGRPGDERQPHALAQSFVQSLQQAQTRDAAGAHGWNVQLGRQELIDHEFTYTEAAPLYR